MSIRENAGAYTGPSIRASGGPEQDPPRPTLMAELAKLATVLDMHESAVANLAKVLEPVMVPASIGGEPLREPEPPASEAVLTARALIARVSAATRDLEQINAALAIK